MKDVSALANSRAGPVPSRGFLTWVRVPALGFAAAVFVAGVANADELRPIEGGSVRLGPDNGSIYYTVEPDGFRLVATVSATPADAPVRFVATLRPGQSVVVSVARALGEKPDEVVIRRVGDRLLYDGGRRRATPMD